MGRRFRIELPPGTALLSANGRENWHARAAVTKNLRETARVLARNAHVPPLGRVKVRVWYYPPDRRRRDTSNLFPSLKACLDGIVDAHIITDDEDTVVRSVEFLPASGDDGEKLIVKKGQLVIELEEL